jgi:hypothetical protein
MRYEDLVKYFENDEKIAELLTYLAENYFNVIDEYKDLLLADELSTIDEMIKAKRNLQGIISSLEPIYSKALSMKKQAEYRYYVVKKETCEKEGTKFVDGSTEKEAKDSVRRYRDVRDLIRGYLNSANGLYYDIRDTLDRTKKEYNREKENS